MAIKLNWKTLPDVKSEIEKTWKLKPDSKVIFVLLLKDDTTHKKTIRFADFLKFFWFIYDSTKFHVKGLVVTDITGKVLYRHRQATNEYETIPHNGNTYIFEFWQHMTDTQKNVYLNILLSQIYDYIESSRNSNS